MKHKDNFQSSSNFDVGGYDWSWLDDFQGLLAEECPTEDVDKEWIFSFAAVTSTDEYSGYGLMKSAARSLVNAETFNNGMIYQIANIRPYDIYSLLHHNLFTHNKTKEIPMSESPILNNRLLEVRTFNELLAVRSLTGIMRINEHHLMNRQSTYLKEEVFTISQLSDDDFIGVIEALEKRGYWCEVRTSTSKNRTVNAYLTTESGLLIVAVVYIFEENKLRYYGYSTTKERALLTDTLKVFSQFVKEKPVVVNYVTGFTDQGPVVDHREIDLEYNVPHDCFYPYIEEGLESLADRFIASTANLLLLVGPRGTGKTSLLREFCRRFGGKDIYQMCGDKVILHPMFDSYLASLPEGSLIIIEDADGILGKRVEQNTSLSMLLNELDGISNKGNKFVITTNIENMKMVDDAILRQGRCFRTVDFRDLTADEANAVADKVGLNKVFTQSISIAEIFNGLNQQVKNSVGFCV